jgi:hypothetical protein
VVFVDDSQKFRNREHFVTEFKNFADFFYPNMVMFQSGYRADKPWWGEVETLVTRTLGQELASQTRQDCGIVWVDFTLRDVLPVDSSPEAAQPRP